MLSAPLGHCQQEAGLQGCCPALNPVFFLGHSDFHTRDPQLTWVARRQRKSRRVYGQPAKALWCWLLTLSSFPQAVWPVRDTIIRGERDSCVFFYTQSQWDLGEKKQGDFTHMHIHAYTEEEEQAEPGGDKDQVGHSASRGSTALPSPCDTRLQNHEQMNTLSDQQFPGATSGDSTTASTGCRYSPLVSLTHEKQPSEPVLGKEAAQPQLGQVHLDP